MTVCLRCRRPLKYPTASGLGPVCAKAGLLLQDTGRDLFPYDLDRAVHAARQRLEAYIDALAAMHLREIRRGFADTRSRRFEGPNA